MPRDERRPRNPYLFLLLRAMFRWEVEFFYKNKSPISISKYIMLAKPVDVNFNPYEQPSMKEDSWYLKHATTIRSYMVDKRNVLHFSEDKLDEFVRTVCILNSSQSWQSFVEQESENEFVQWSDEIYEEFRDDKTPKKKIKTDKKAWLERKILVSNLIDRQVDKTLLERISIRSMEGVFAGKPYWKTFGNIINPSRSFRLAFPEDFDQIESLATKQDQSESYSVIQSIYKIDWLSTWILVNEVGQIFGSICVIPMTKFLFDYFSDRKPVGRKIGIQDIPTLELIIGQPLKKPYAYLIFNTISKNKGSGMTMIANLDTMFSKRKFFRETRLILAELDFSGTVFPNWVLNMQSLKSSELLTVPKLIELLCELKLANSSFL